MTERRSFPPRLLRYGMAAVAVGASLGLRWGVEAMVGSGLATYITFYPAVMAVALLAGFGPGLLATALTVVATAYWILPPAGFAIGAPVDRMGAVLFSGMGLFMSVVAKLYRDSRSKAAAYDREQALRASREALRESEERLRLALEASRAGVWEWDLRTGANYWSPETFRLYGLAPDSCQPSYDAWRQVVHPLDRERAVAVVQEAVRAKMDINFEFRVNLSAERWLLSRGRLMRDATGTPVRYLGMVMDITESRRVEQSLVTERANLQRIFDAANVGMLLVDGTGEVKRVNSAVVRWAGKDAHHLVRVQPGNVLGCIHAIRHPEGCGHAPTCAICPIRNAFATVQRTGEAVHNVEVEATLELGGEKTQVWLAVSADPLVIDGEPHVILTLNNITDLKRAQSQLEQLTADLQRSNKDLEEFAYVASHDLQGPVRRIASYAGILEEECGAQLPAQARVYTAIMRDSARRMTQLIRDLLAYSRVGASKRRTGRVDLERVLQTVLTDQAVVIQECNAAVSHDPLPVVRGDETQIAQVLSNLIGNAVKFRRKEAAPRVHVSAVPSDGLWQVSVRDNGIGVAPRYAEKLFKLFQRLHSEEEYPGTGIGLAICKKIIERHGGRIWFDSQPGQGCTFHFTLPADETEAP